MPISTRKLQLALRAAPLAEKTAGAYSADRYADWSGLIRALLKRGYTEPQVEAIVASKWTRWAADASEAKYGKVPARALLEWMEKAHKTPEHLAKEVADLTTEHFASSEEV